VDFIRGTVVRIRPHGLLDALKAWNLADAFIVARSASRQSPRIGRSTDFAVLTARLGAEAGPQDVLAALAAFPFALSASTASTMAIQTALREAFGHPSRGGGYSVAGAFSFGAE